MKIDTQKLIDARETKGWDQTTLAYKCGVSVSTISRVESGERCSPKTIKKIADKLGLSIEELRLSAEPVVETLERRR